MTKTYHWTTPRGAKIAATITSEHVTHDIVDADGYKIEVKCDRWDYRVDDITVNGKPTELKRLWIEDGKRCILIGMRGKDRILVALPADVEQDVYGEEKAHAKARTLYNAKLQDDMDAHRAAVEKMMNP